MSGSKLCVLCGIDSDPAGVYWFTSARMKRKHEGLVQSYEHKVVRCENKAMPGCDFVDGIKPGKDTSLGLTSRYRSGWILVF